MAFGSEVVHRLLLRNLCGVWLFTPEGVAHLHLSLSLLLLPSFSSFFTSVDQLMVNGSASISGATGLYTFFGYAKSVLNFCCIRT